MVLGHNGENIVYTSAAGVTDGAPITADGSAHRSRGSVRRALREWQRDSLEGERRARVHQQVSPGSPIAGPSGLPAFNRQGQDVLLSDVLASPAGHSAALGRLQHPVGSGSSKVGERATKTAGAGKRAF